MVLELAVILMTVFLLAARSAWRTGHVGSGMIVALSIGAVGSVVFIAGTIFETAIWSGGTSFKVFASWLIWIPYVTLSLAALFGTAGAVIGKVLRITVVRRRTA